jgi:ferrous iron transport protein B
MAVAAESLIRTAVLIGNPNTGKSTLFAALSGVHQRIGNYPGVTVEKKVGQMVHGGTRWSLVDLPGTYSLAPRSLDEMVAVDVLLGRRDDVPEPDVVLCVVDANNLERNLYLVSQVLELGRPVVVALTMLDVAEGRGHAIDVPRLERQLGVPVVSVQAHKRQGLDALRDAVARAVDRPAVAPESPFPPAFRDEVDGLGALLKAARAGRGAAAEVPRYLVERLILDGGGYVEDDLLTPADGAVRAALAAARERLGHAGCPVPAVEAMARYGWVGRATEGVVARPDVPLVTWSDRVDAILTHRLIGTFVLAAIMLVLFNAVFSWASAPMDAIDAALGRVGEAAAAILPEGTLRSLVVDGVLAGIGGVLVFLPQILILFFFLGVLEDCGYLARAAYLMDRLMVRVGLSGKSFIPLLSSFACAIPGVMATRVIEDRRDRLTTILIAPLMSCSARLPVYALMIAAFVPRRKLLGGLVGTQGLTLFAMYLLGILVAAAVALLLKRTVLRGATPPFVMELPAYKWPSPRVVFLRMLERAWEFLHRAGTIIVAVSIVMWALLYYPRLPESEAARYAAQRQALEAAGPADPTAEAKLADLAAHEEGARRRQSLLGRMGRLIEPVVRPLGWDWRIGAAVIASFPAREVVVATFGVIFDAGPDVEDESGGGRLRDALHGATWPDSGRRLFTLPVALSIMVFFALCAQCVSTLAVIRRETNSRVWPLVSFAYMTTLAYVGAFLTYQIGTRFFG